jgi:uracil-DNA glycosylase family 4
VVPGEGPQPSRGMIVGEAPGRKEVELGRPFVGQAGRLLDTVLRAVGINRSGVYITNIVKELPLDSEERIRRPYQSEIKAWLPILEGEIACTAPAAILALGRTAAISLCGLGGDIPFGSKVGNVYTAWHPAYLLRSRSDYEEWLEQIRPWAWAVGEAE